MEMKIKRFKIKPGKFIWWVGILAMAGGIGAVLYYCMVAFLVIVGG